MSKSHNLAMMLATASVIRVAGFPLREPKKPRKCNLKECQCTTTHNGGYCCAEHCKLDRERSKMKGVK